MSVGSGEKVEVWVRLSRRIGEIFRVTGWIRRGLKGGNGLIATRKSM